MFFKMRFENKAFARQYKVNYYAQKKQSEQEEITKKTNKLIENPDERNIWMQ